MTWVKLDDGFTRHPRMVAAGLHGRALFVAGLCYCGTHLTDGMIPKAAVVMLVAEAGCNKRAEAKLVEVGSWIDRGDAYEVHDFLVYNPTREKVLRKREEGIERAKRSRETRAKQARTSAGASRDPSRPEGSRDGAGFTGGEAASTALAASGSAVESEEEPLGPVEATARIAEIRQLARRGAAS